MWTSLVRERINTRFKPKSLIFYLLLIIIYLPSIILKYLVHNDYFTKLDFFWFTNLHPESKQLLGIGRPFDFLIVNGLVSPLSNSTIGLFFLRLASVLLILLIFAEFKKFFTLLSLSENVSAFLAFGVCLLPGTQYGLQCFTAMVILFALIFIAKASNCLLTGNVNQKNLTLNLRSFLYLFLATIAYPPVTPIYTISIAWLLTKRRTRLISWKFFDFMFFTQFPWLMNFVIGKFFTALGVGQPVGNSYYSSQLIKVPNFTDFIEIIRGLLSFGFGGIYGSFIVIIVILSLAMSIFRYYNNGELKFLLIIFSTFLPIFLVDGYAQIFLSTSYKWFPESRSVIGYQSIIMFVMAVLARKTPGYPRLIQISLFCLLPFVFFVLCIARINYSLAKYHQEFQYLNTKIELKNSDIEYICFQEVSFSHNRSILSGDLERRILNSHIASGAFPLWYKTQTGKLLPITLSTCSPEDLKTKVVLKWPEFNN